MRHKILMTMIEVGFGHKAPALAVSEALQELYPDELQVDVVDFAKVSGALKIDEQCKKSWDFALAFPASARIGYLLVEMAGMNQGYLDAIFKDFVEKGIAYIHDYKPDIVFATHPLCMFVAIKAREALGLDFKVISYVVDPFDGYAWWANLGADMLLVASERSRDRLLKKGILPEKIKIIGFPLNKSFLNIRGDLENLKAELGLEADRPIILVSAGSQGIATVFLYVEMVARLNLPINIITVAGRNAKTKKRMDALAGISAQTKIVSLGFATNMNELMSIADLIVGKAGAATAMESMFLQKPVMFTEWAAYNDRYIINFILDYGIGFYCPNFYAFSKILREIALSDRLEFCRKNLAELNMKPGTNEVAEYLYGQLNRVINS